MASLFKSRTVPQRTDSADPGERRQLTVLFYDVAGSTEILQSTDPEDARNALLSVHEDAQACIAAENGALVQIMGDGGMAYFGYPVSSEDAVFQALRAACNILETRGGSGQPGRAAPDVRIGIATSVVILPSDRDAVRTGGLGAVGVAPNLAARLQSAAPLNAALVGPVTRDLAFRAFAFERVDDLDLKGFPEVTTAYRLVGRRDVASRYAMSRADDTPLVAREAEAAMLRRLWSAARDGRGDAILLTGEAGIGKSRLVDALPPDGDPARRILLQCQPATESEALHAIVAMYEDAYRNSSADPELAEAAMATAELLHDLENRPTLSAEARRQAIVSGSSDILTGLARARPLLIIAEDLHWADEVTEAVLEYLSQQAADLPMLIVGTSRPDGADFAPAGAFQRAELSALAADDTAALVRQILGSRASDDMLQWIVTRSDGNPLFASELARFVRQALDSGKGEAAIRSAGQVDSLRDLLASRLDAVGPSKRTALAASVIGRDVPLDLLSDLVGRDIERDVLEADLERLVVHGIKEVHDSGRIYSFRHALMRDAAYASQTRAQRRALHGRIVDLAHRIDHLAYRIPGETLAEHCLQADRPAEAARLLIEAAETSLARSAQTGPRAMLEQAYRLAQELDDTDLSRDLQLRAIAVLGPLVTHADGPRAAAGLYEHGQALCLELASGERGRWIPILWGWWFTAGNLNEQTRRSDILIRSVTRDESDEARLQALHCAWATFFDGGAHASSLAAVDEGLALYDPREAELSRYRYGHDARVCGLGERSLSLWMSGDLSGSRAAIIEAEAWAEKTNHAPSILHALDIATQTAFFDRNFDELDRLLRRVATLSADAALPAVHAKRQIFGAWAAARTGGPARPDLVADGVEQLRAIGVLEDTPIYADIAAQVAQVAQAAMDVDDAVANLDAEIDLARDTNLVFWLPELLRRRAEIQGGEDAVRWLDEGLELALSQEAAMLVLRNAATRIDLGLTLHDAARDMIAGRASGLATAPEFDRVSRELGL